MRGLFKAAALLSSTLASALVIPDPALGALDVRPSDPIVEHIPSEATLKFVINTVQAVWGYPILTFEISGTDRACGESDIKLNGQKLEPQWEGFHGFGEGVLEAYGNARMSWTVQCIYDSTSAAHFLDRDGIQVFTLTLLDTKGRPTTPGFTISYRQIGKPTILRFEAEHIVLAGHNGYYPEWQTSHPPFSPAERPVSSTNPFPETAVSSSHNEQKTIQSHAKDVKEYLKDGLHKVVGTLKKMCHKQASKIAQNKEPTTDEFELKASEMASAGNETRQVADQEVGKAAKTQFDTVEGLSEGDDADMIENTVTAASAVGQAKATETRSIYPPESSGYASESPYTHNHNGVPSTKILKIFFIGLAIFSTMTWIILWHRDPRRRADRAARREERLTKRLYRRAARRQKIKNWIWDIKMKYGLLFVRVLNWNGKSQRVEQEEIAEDVMKDDIRALSNAHRVVSAMTGTASAAEEGHAGYDQDESRLRSSRSLITLPGYESEGAGPPGYTSEFNSDSSVVSTSPRISLSSGGYEEKVEYIDLGGGRVGDVRR